MAITVLVGECSYQVNFFVREGSYKRSSEKKHSNRQPVPRKWNANAKGGTESRHAIDTHGP